MELVLRVSGQYNFLADLLGRVDVWWISFCMAISLMLPVLSGQELVIFIAVRRNPCVSKDLPFSVLDVCRCLF